MNILTPPESTPQPTTAERQAAALITGARSIAEHTAREWMREFDALWTITTVTPAERLDALGPAAAQLFALSNAMVQFLAGTIAQSRPDLWQGIQDRLDSLPDFEIHDDGTVTLADPDAGIEPEIELEPAE